MKIALASDHAGIGFKRQLEEELRGLGHQLTDYGTDAEESCDYPDFAIPATRSVADGSHDRAILICNNGIGMSMVANKIKGIRAAMVYSEETAQMTRGHHDSNVLCLGAAQFPAEELLKMARVWLETPFEGGRHARRAGKINALD